MNRAFSTKSTTILLFIFITCSSIFLVSAEESILKPSSKIAFCQNCELPNKVTDFSVTEDEFFIFPDYKSGDIKIYVLREDRADGDFLEFHNRLGRKGFYTNEFLGPSYCFYYYNYNEDPQKTISKFGVLDVKKRIIAIYDKDIRDATFTLDQEIDCLPIASYIKLSGEKLIIAGHPEAGSNLKYQLYLIDLKNNSKKYLLPAYLKYGYNTKQEYLFKKDKKTNRLKKNKKYDKLAIGFEGKFDIQGNYIYYGWVGDLKLFKINMLADVPEDSIDIFSHKSHFKSPSSIGKLIEAYNSNDAKQLEEERKKLFYLRNVFTSANNLIVIYEGPRVNNPKRKFWIQFYSFDGTFLHEKELMGIKDKKEDGSQVYFRPDEKMYFDKVNNMLYSLGSYPNETGEKYHFYLLKYEIPSY